MSVDMPRYIYTAKPSLEIPTLIQSIFISEILKPSQTLWLVAPWISDIPIIDNGLNQFLSLEPQWARKKVSLSAILVFLLSKGTKIYIGTRPNEHSGRFLQELREHASHFLSTDQLVLKTKPELHAKGLLGDNYYLSGSANFTVNGIQFLEESIQFTINPALVAEARISFLQHWGD